MARHALPEGEAHQLGLGCGCRPVLGVLTAGRARIAVVRHRGFRQRWRVKTRPRSGETG